MVPLFIEKFARTALADEWRVLGRKELIKNKSDEY
jgi:hypothetical protein